MAYVPLTEDEKKQQQGAQQVGPEQVLTSGESTTPSTAQASAPVGATAPAPRPSGSGWTNLQSYVKANEGSDAVMGQTVGAQFQGKQAKANDSVSAYGQGANDLVSASTIKDNGVVSGLALRPAQVKAEDFSRNLTGWKGPDSAGSVAGYNEAGRAVQDTRKVADQAQDFEGRRTLLQDAYKEPRYSAGEQRLDSFLVGAGTGGRSELAKVDQSAKDFSTGWDGLLGTINQGIASGRQTSEQTKADTTAAFQGASGRTTSALKKKRDDLSVSEAAAEESYQGLTRDLQAADPAARARAFERLGIDPALGEWAVFNKFDPMKLAVKGAGRGLGDVVGQDLQDDYGALKTLGQAGGFAPLEEFDLKATGNDGRAFRSNDDVAKKLAGGKAIDQLVGKRIQDGNAARRNQYETTKSALAGNDVTRKSQILGQLGVHPTLMNEAAALGLDLSSFLRAGRQLNAGDVATDADRSGWDALVAELGLTPDGTLADTQDEGASFTFDQGALQQGLGSARARKAERDRLDQIERDNIASAKKAAEIEELIEAFKRSPQ